MSKNCNYIYVQGLRFRPEDVKVLWVDVDRDVEHHVQLRKTGTGKAIFDRNSIPLSVTPKDLRKMFKKGETVRVIVRIRGESRTENEKVMLRLDPRQAEGRKGRKAFDAGSLAGLPPRALRALALEQLKTAPYGAENRDEAVARMLWSLENLDDDAIAKELKSKSVWRFDGPATSRNVELAALLLSDDALVGSLMRDGKHESLLKLLQIAPLAMATLADTSRPADEVLAEVALGLIGGMVYPQGDPVGLGLDPHGDPAVHAHAVSYLTDLPTLKNLLSKGDTAVRLEALKRFSAVAPRREAEKLFSEIIRTDSDPAVRVEAVSLVSSDQMEGILREFGRDASPAVFAAALERIRYREGGSEHASAYIRDLVKETLYEEEVDLTSTYQVRLRSAATRPSDAVLEYLLTGPVNLGGEQGDGLAFAQSVASALHDPTAQLRVAGNTAIAADVRAVVVAGIADAQERAWFTDLMHPTAVRLAAITGTTSTTDRRVRETLDAKQQERAWFKADPLPERLIIELARDHNPEVRRAAAGELRDTSVLMAMVATDKDAAGEAAANLLMMSYGDPALFTGLLEALSTSLSGGTHDADRSQELVDAAAKAAQGLMDKAMDGEIADVVRSAQAPEVRLEAVKAMTRYSERGNTRGNRPSGTSEVLYQETLVRLAANDVDDKVRVTAAAGVRDQKALSDLLDSSPYEEVRKALTDNVVNIEVLARVAQNDVSPSVRERAVYRCRTIGSGAVMRDTLHAVALKDSDPGVRKAALGDAIDQSVCEDVARKDPDPTVRSHAVSFIRNKAVLADIATKDADPQVRADALGWYNER